MKTLQNYIQDFFALLNSAGKTDAEQRFTNTIKMALLTFLDNETKENAATVYEIFFSTYRIVLEGSKNTFIDLLDILSAYEERAATLIDKQRDHSGFMHLFTKHQFSHSLQEGEHRSG